MVGKVEFSCAHWYLISWHLKSVMWTISKKFIFDALNGVAYVDDGQIASVCVTKILDNTDECHGATVISIFPLTEAEIKMISQVEKHV